MEQDLRYLARVRAILTLFLLALSASLAAAEPPARIDAKLRARGWKYLGSGWTADVWRSPDGKSVYKRIKSTIASGDLMPVPDAAKRAAFVKHSIWVIEALRSAPEFAAYRHLLPRTSRLGRFGMTQAVASGVQADTLTGAARARAETVRNAIKEAAQHALPGVEIDANIGNILFDATGAPVKNGFFDPAGGWWARTWTKAHPVTRDVPAGSTALLDRKLAQDPRGFQRSAGMLRVGDGYAYRLSGGNLKFGDALLIANLDKNDAFVVKHGFKMAYEEVDHPASAGRPLGEVLGLPVDEEHADASPGAKPGQVIQHFEHGALTWSEAGHTQVQLR